MRSDHFLRFKDPGGALLIVERAIAAEFGYTTSQEEIPTVTLEEMRNRQRNVNLVRAEHRKAKASRRAGANIAVAVLQRQSDGQEVRGEDDPHPTAGPETRGDDVEGGQPVAALPPDEGGGEAGSTPVPGVIGAWDLGRTDNGEGATLAVADPDDDPEAVAIPQLVALFTGGQEGINDNQTVVNGS